MSDTLLRAVTHGHIPRSSITDLDPSLFLSLPRLTIVSGLLHYPDMVDLVNPDRCIRWFRDKCVRMAPLKDELSRLSGEDVEALERMLCGSYGNGDDGEVAKEVRYLFPVVCAMSDDLQTGPRAKEFVQVLNNVL